MTNITNNKRRIALLLGSFNPLHIGHVAIANYVAAFTDVDEVWFVVSPHNPLKEAEGLLPEVNRLAMVQTAISDLPLPFKVCDVEMNMPKPSYTIDTLHELSKIYLNYEFTLVMGADSIADIERWKNYADILANYRVFVYPRTGVNAQMFCNKYGVTYIDAPLINISATFVRKALAEGRNIAAFLPCGVYQYICKHNLYKK